jgi:chorismate mutase-like protein
LDFLSAAPCRIEHNADDPVKRHTQMPQLSNQRGPLLHIPLLIVALLSAGTASAAAQPLAVVRDAIAARLALMDDVARHKWNAGLPIAAPEREAALLEAVTTVAVAKGLPEDYARDVIAAQIDASRALQTALFERWQASGQGNFVAVPDLNTVQRPRIDAATRNLLDAVAAARCALAAVDAKTQLAAPPADFAAPREVWSMAVAPLPTTSPCR